MENPEVGNSMWENLWETRHSWEKKQKEVLEFRQSFEEVLCSWCLATSCCRVLPVIQTWHTVEGDPGKHRSAWAGRWWVRAQERDFAQTAFPEQFPYPFPLTHCSLLFSFAFGLQWETWWLFVARHWFIFSVAVYASTSSSVSDNLTQFAVIVESNGAMINSQHWTDLHSRQMLIFLR